MTPKKLSPFKDGTKGKIMVDNALKVINDFPEVDKWTIRQLYYQLVAHYDLENTLYFYTRVSANLVRARKLGLFPYGKIEDRDRTILSNIGVDYYDWKQEVDDKIERAFRPPYRFLDRNLYQNKICVIVLEKKALEGVFKAQITNMNQLVTCKGFNSLTQIKELADILEGETREMHLYTFSDYDPSGEDIERNFIDEMRFQGIEFTSFRRMGLNEDQVVKYNLPSKPPKEKDPRTNKWVETKKGGLDQVVELDALNPKILTNLINECQEECWDHEADYRREKLERVQRKLAKKRYFKLLENKIKEYKKKK